MAEDNEKPLFKGIGWIIGVSAGVAILLLVLFLWHQTFDLSLSVDTGIFGTYGDFIGGVIGTIVAFYSAFLLIKTFQNQYEINKDIQKTNNSIISANNSIITANQRADAASQRQFYQTELQLFDSKFRSFLDAYQSAVNHYVSEHSEGRMAFEELAKGFIDQEFNNNNDYKRRSNSATDEYLLFYADHQTMLSVHLRMLYLLVSLISNSDLEEEDKVQYAKLVRGQMSNAEMLIVRYNCKSLYGKKMQTYCNQYNLTKHLSVMYLLEFKEFRTIIENYALDNDENAEKMLSGLNSMFITLRKKATGMLYDGGNETEAYKSSHNYTIKLTCSQDKKSFDLLLNKIKGGRRGGGARISPDEKALDCFSEEQLVVLFKDFMTELFCISNYEIYNEGAEIKQIGKTISTANECSFKLSATGTKRLALSYLQKTNRDNPVEVIEVN